MQDQQADGHFFVDLFYEICGAYAQHRTTQEIRFDDETFPEMWAFVWDAGDTPFGLPLSPYGSPAVAYWDDTGVQRFIKTFGELDHAASRRARTPMISNRSAPRWMAGLKGFSCRMEPSPKNVSPNLTGGNSIGMAALAIR